LILRVIAHPRFTNALGDIYAGWLLDQMDQAAAQIAMKTSGGRCATVSIENVDFIAPVPVGSEVSIYGELEDVGRSSMQIRIEVWITEQDAESYKSTETRFVFVAIDSNGRIRQVPGS
jgi:acyl-CoA thioesterase YciA